MCADTDMRPKTGSYIGYIDFSVLSRHVTAPTDKRLDLAEVITITDR